MSDASQDVLSNSAGIRLKTIIERVEQLDAEKDAILADTKEVYAEAKSEGFDTKILRKVVRLRKMDVGKRREEEALLDLYLSALEGVTLSGESAAQVAAYIGLAPPASTRPDLDEETLYSEAVVIVVRDRKASTSYIQRRLQLGYNRAASLIERMERESVIGPPNHAGRREVLRPPPGAKPAPDSVAVASINGRSAVKDAYAAQQPVAPNPYDRGTPQHRVWAEAARDEALKLGVEL
jgi:uncharacterized protein (UPF0335 family)